MTSVAQVMQNGEKKKRNAGNSDWRVEWGSTDWLGLPVGRYYHVKY